MPVRDLRRARAVYRHGRVGQIEGVYGIFKKPWNDRELLKRVESLAHLRRSASRRGRRASDLRAGPVA